MHGSRQARLICEDTIILPGSHRLNSGSCPSRHPLMFLPTSKPAVDQTHLMFTWNETFAPTELERKLVACGSIDCSLHPRSPEESPLHLPAQLLCCTVGGSSRALHQPCHTRVRVVASRVNLSEEQVSQLVVPSNNLDLLSRSSSSAICSRLLFAPRNERSAGPSNDLASSPRTRTSGSPSS